MRYLEAGASHIIVTSYVFSGGKIAMDRLEELVSLVGKSRMVIDLSCRRRPENPSGPFYVVTDKWTKFTDFEVNADTLRMLANYCDEFLVHGVDVEGKRCGIEEDLVDLLGKHSPVPVTYAGGVRCIEDLELVKRIGADKVDCTVGSALDIFGGDLSYDSVLQWHRKENPV
jgi:phosphoribosylformimino-5-aminoimidazole carboxamide ribotide isomerase